MNSGVQLFDNSVLACMFKACANGMEQSNGEKREDFQESCIEGEQAA